MFQAGIFSCFPSYGVYMCSIYLIATTVCCMLSCWQLLAWSRDCSSAVARRQLCNASSAGSTTGRLRMFHVRIISDRSCNITRISGRYVRQKLQSEARACVCMHSISFSLSKTFEVCFIHSTHRKDMSAQAMTVTAAASCLQAACHITCMSLSSSWLQPLVG